MERGALVVVACVGRHAVVDEQLHIGCIAIHTGLEEGACNPWRQVLVRGTRQGENACGSRRPMQPHTSSSLYQRSQNILSHSVVIP